MPIFRIYREEVTLYSADIEADTYEAAVLKTLDLAEEYWEDLGTERNLSETDEPEIIEE